MGCCRLTRFSVRNPGVLPRAMMSHPFGVIFGVANVIPGLPIRMSKLQRDANGVLHYSPGRSPGFQVLYAIACSTLKGCYIIFIQKRISHKAAIFNFEL